MTHQEVVVIFGPMDAAVERLKPPADFNEREYRIHRNAVESTLAVIAEVIENDEALKTVSELGRRLKYEGALDLSIDDLDISVRAANCLKRAGIMTTRQIIHCNPDDLLGIQFFDGRCLAEVVTALAKCDLELLKY